MSDVMIIRGDDRVLVSTVVDEEGLVVDLTGTLEAEFTLKRYPADDVIVLAKALGTGIAIPNPPTGEVHTTLTVTDTEGLLGAYVFDVEIVDVEGNRTTVDQGHLLVEGDLNSTVASGTILQAGDYDAIRNILGVTNTDLTDDVIESMQFGQQADAYVKEKVPGWETQNQTSEGSYRLRLATVYLTAAYIAESHAKGGYLGFIYPPGRTFEQWDALAKQFRGSGDEWVGFAQAADEEAPSSALHSVPLMVLAGPTRAAGDETSWPPLPWTNFG